MTYVPIDLYDVENLPDSDDPANYHVNFDALAVYLTSLMVPGLNTRLEAFNAALAGDAGDLAASLATLLSTPLGDTNVIINGGFQVNQRGHTSGAALAADEYGHDRWIAGAGGGIYSFATVENETTITITAGTIGQIIDGESLQSGTYTLVWEGTAQAQVDGGGYADSPIQVTVTGGDHTFVEFGAGTVGKVRMHPGVIAMPSILKPKARAELECLQYCWRTRESRSMVAQVYGSSGVCYASGLFRVPMRATPDVSLTGTPETSGSTFSNGYNVTGIAVTEGTSRNSYGVAFTASSSGRTPGSITILSFSDTNYIEFDSELYSADL